jgi:Fe-S-cluster containining protein
MVATRGRRSHQLTNELDRRSYFFDEGIRFQCQGCGTCCTGAPGVVRVDEQEIVAIAVFIERSVAETIDTFLFPWANGHSVREDDDGRCLFYDDGCRIYPVRPRQCRTFPFWFSIMRAESRWNAIRSQCPGIGTGRRYTKAEILKILAGSR